jgi:sigma-B regulation protein RsbU (phosphoserine phosphatase)
MASIINRSSSPGRGFFRSVRSRMLFWILAVSVPIYAGALYMSHEASARRLEASAEREVDELVARLVAGVDAVISPVEGAIRTVAFQLEEVAPPRAQYTPRILGILRAWPDVYGSTIAVEPATAAGAGGDDATPFAPYYFRQAEGFGYSDLAEAQYGYQQLPWYRQPADTQQPVWSLPYFDDGGGDIWMLTYSVPFFRRDATGQRALAGVVTADIDLEWVKRMAAQASPGAIGMGWLLSPVQAERFVAPIGDTAERVLQFDRDIDVDAIRAAGQQLLGGNAGLVLLPPGLTAKPAYLAVRDLQTVGWQAMLVIPEAQLMAEASALLRRQLLLGAIGLVLLLLAILGVSAGIARPIHALAVAVGKAREDNLDLQLPSTARRDEIGVLTGALRSMGSSLRQHIQLQAESLAERGRLEHELQIAASIQQSMLPRAGAAAELPASVQVAAALLPARQVGGDLYDYFTLPNGDILFAIGDVSDKGIPAALFMARLSALLRMEGATSLTPDVLLGRINARLAEGNDACMFVTMACVLLHPGTGRILYASAGHEAPLLRNVEGSLRTLPMDNGAAIGIEAVSEYQLHQAHLAPGDTLLLYTDGVTDAEATDGSMFGSDRLAELLRGSADGGTAAIAGSVVDTVAAHAASYHATDDLTVLAIRWNPPGVTFHADAQAALHWRIEPGLSDLTVTQVQQWLHAILAAREVSSERITDVELIAEELLTNLLRSEGSPAAVTAVSVDCLLTPTEIVMTFHDDGPAFDPLARDDPSLDDHIDDRSIGGLGILMVKRLAGSCSYARTAGCNVLEVHLSRDSTSS